MKTREQIIAEHPLEQVLADHGVVMKGGGNERTARCPFHDDSTASFCINVAKQLWTCQAGCGGGSVIDLLAKFEGISAGAVLKKYGGDDAPKPKSKPAAKPQLEKPAAPNPAAKAVAFYDYPDASGKLVFQVVRYEPGKKGGKKSFSQRQPGCENPRNEKDGDWIWNMEGVTRVLYQLPQLLKTKQPIWIVAGEKDANNVSKLGMVATTNAGGEKHWLEAYAEAFKDKEVILCGDNDKPGKEHMADVLASLAGKCKSVREVTVPTPHKDISDYLAQISRDEIAKNPDVETHAVLETQFVAVQKLVESAPMYDRGVNLPIKSVGELEIEFVQSIAKAGTRSLDFKSWLPTLGNVVRPMVPGELITIIAATKVGKSALAANLMMHAAPLKVLYFQQELPGSLSFERYVAMATATPAKEVYHQYKSGNKVDWRTGGRLDHVFTLSKTRRTLEMIEDAIVKSELKIGERPALFVVDYIQLMGGDGERYSRITDAAEGLKQVALNTGTVAVMLSQRGRAGVPGQDDSTVEVRLTDGKESGGIENSSGLVLGAWRDATDLGLLNLKVLANTKGFPGKLIKCNFDGERMIITERAESGIDDADVPTHNQPTVQQPMADA